MTEVDRHHHVAFAARPADGGAQIVADARYVLRADSADAEFAIAVAVANDWQGAGLGRELLLRLAAHAKVPRPLLWRRDRGARRTQPRYFDESRPAARSCTLEKPDNRPYVPILTMRTYDKLIATIRARRIA